MRPGVMLRADLSRLHKNIVTVLMEKPTAREIGRMGLLAAGGSSLQDSFNPGRADMIGSANIWSVSDHI